MTNLRKNKKHILDIVFWNPFTGSRANRRAAAYVDKEAIQEGHEIHIGSLLESISDLTSGRISVSLWLYNGETKEEGRLPDRITDIDLNKLSPFSPRSREGEEFSWNNSHIDDLVSITRVYTSADFHGYYINEELSFTHDFSLTHESMDELSWLVDVIDGRIIRSYQSLSLSDRLEEKLLDGGWPPNGFINDVKNNRPVILPESLSLYRKGDLAS